MFCSHDGLKYWFDEELISRKGFKILLNYGNDLDLISRFLLFRGEDPSMIDEYDQKYWYKGGKLHREEGPAIEYEDEEEPDWCLNGIHYTFEDWLKLTPGFTDEEKIEIKLRGHL